MIALCNRSLESVRRFAIAVNYVFSLPPMKKLFCRHAFPQLLWSWRRSIFAFIQPAVGFGHDRTHREVSSDGIELRLAVNYLAPFVLTHELLQRGLPRRAVVNLSSIGQEPLDFDDLLCERRYDGVSAYRRSKLALILWTLDLAAALPGLGCVALHPGTLLDTGMVRDAGISPRGPARRGGETTLVAIERALAGTSGRYFDEDREARALPQAYDDAARCRLRELTLSLVEPFVTHPPQGPA